MKHAIYIQSYRSIWTSPLTNHQTIDSPRVCTIRFLGLSKTPYIFPGNVMVVCRDGGRYCSLQPPKFSTVGCFSFPPPSFHPKTECCHVLRSVPVTFQGLSPFRVAESSIYSQRMRKYRFRIKYLCRFNESESEVFIFYSGFILAFDSRMVSVSKQNVGGIKMGFLFEKFIIMYE